MPWSLISTRNETVQIARGGWLDALRFIVAFLIILHHFQAAGPEPLERDRIRRTDCTPGASLTVALSSSTSPAAESTSPGIAR